MNVLNLQIINLKDIPVILQDRVITTWLASLRVSAKFSWFVHRYKWVLKLGTALL
jgi:hypothetical protein